jgi:hypothetical protein
MWKRIFYERLTEPVHLNALSLLVGAFGSYRQKVEYDLVIRHYNAFGILKAADQARALGLSKLCVIEFGVASGAGLMNMCAIASKVAAITGVDIKVVGFDTGKGMPAARDYRDHPDLYQEGDFPMNFEALRSRLPPTAQLILGDIATTVPQFLREQISPECPIGYVMLDVDYYSSTVDAFQLFQGDSRSYLPVTVLYVDDIHFDVHNPFAGELLAISEFNEQNKLRKICPANFLENSRLFRNAEWIKHIFYLHVMDHPTRSAGGKRAAYTLANPYLG